MDLLTYDSPFGPGVIRLESAKVRRHAWGAAGARPNRGPAENPMGRASRTVPASPEIPDVSSAEPDLAVALADYFNGRPADLSGWAMSDFDGISEFAAKVYKAVTTLKWGQTATYSDIAAMIGRPRAVRAVGTALGKNPAPLFIPCHRVLSKGGLGGWSGPPGLKEKLLTLEGWQADEICS